MANFYVMLEMEIFVCTANTHTHTQCTHPSKLMNMHVHACVHTHRYPYILESDPTRFFCLGSHIRITALGSVLDEYQHPVNVQIMLILLYIIPDRDVVFEIET